MSTSQVQIECSQTKNDLKQMCPTHKETSPTSLRKVMSGELIEEVDCFGMSS